VNHTSIEKTTQREGVELYLDPRLGKGFGTKNNSMNASLLKAGIFLLCCFAIALIGALDEYFLWTNMREFFALHDIAHHEVIELVVVAFGLGVFARTLASRIQLGQLRNTILLQIPVPIARRSARALESGAAATSTGHSLPRQ
jgi:hypothetical protein